MVLWLVFAILTAAVAFALLRPLLLGTSIPLGAPDGGHDADAAVYRDQLAEIDADLKRGVIAQAEADGARAEVARRIIAHAESKDRTQVKDQAGQLSIARSVRSWMARAISISVPLFAVALYAVLGSPGMPEKPYVDPGSKPIERASREELVAMVEARLKSNPQDGRGWAVIAPVYVGQGRFAEAADAYARSIKLLGESPALLKGQAEATIFANNGLVTETARAAFARIVELEPDNGEAQFGLALAKEQDGMLKEAADDYQRILDSAPANARWRPALEVRLAKLLRGGAPASAEAAEALGKGKEQRDQLILGMVERLAARLKADGKDLSGWQQLMKSYKVLGRDSDATAALAEAKRNFEGDTKALAELDAFAKNIGLSS